MKLFQYYISPRATRIGMVTENGCVALPQNIRMVDLIDKDAAYIRKFCALEPLEGEIRYAPVIKHPEKVLCIGLNYNEHISETKLQKDSKPGFPPVFPKFANALLGHGNDLQLPEQAHQFDYEAELVIVMGKTCSRVDAKDALDYVAGYTVGNDFSARDLQFVTSQWTMGKACDGFAPVGPYFTSKDEVDPDNLAISCRVNGVTVQQSNTNRMIYSCAEIISYLSKFITLKKGDLIYTGTPSGVILGKSENERRWLKAGDVVTVEIEGLGVLENRLV